ncbi:MAG: ABC-type transport auxiliary lipoprotein family protein [Thiobacillus sp.]|nr:ABC-type transport auxiliary lipoprotein family protein [Thiobacillus sp.]
MKSLTVLLALSFVLTGCVNVGNRSAMPAVVYYVLDDVAPAAEATPARTDALKDPDPLRAEARVASRILLVLDTATGSFYDTDQLVFSRSAGTRGQYQFARWTERPGKRFADLMRARLDRQGIWNVSAAGGYVRGDVLLDTELIEFYHDATRQPGHMRLVLRAELVDLKQRTILGRRVFEQQVALTTYDAAGAAQASNQAARRTLDELVDWLATLQ